MYRIVKSGGLERTWYYVQDSQREAIECAVDFYNMNDSFEKEQAISMFQRIESGKLNGIRLSGYAIFCYPSKSSNFESFFSSKEEISTAVEEMAAFFLNEKVMKEPYLFFDSKVTDDAFVLKKNKATEVIRSIEEEHFLTVSKPSRTIVPGLDYKFECVSTFLKGIPFFKIVAKNNEATFLSALGRFYVDDSKYQRKKAKRLISRYEKGKKLISKVDGFQIFLVANMWDESILSKEDALVILNQMAKFFKDEHIFEVPRWECYQDMSDEQYDENYSERDKEAWKDTKKKIVVVIICGIVMAILAKAGLLIGIFGVALFIAYFGDMIARR